MSWNQNLNTISCGVSNDKRKDLAIVEELQLYTEQKEESMDENKYRLDASDDDKLATEVTGIDYKLVALDNYLIGKVTPVENGMIVEYVKKQSQYPKTYKECCEVLGLHTLDNDAKGYKWELIIRLQELLIARDAYWKIAGNWKPDWENDDQDKYVIEVVKNKITLHTYPWNNSHFILAFHTVEMRNAFYENFNELINDCKELL